jgi:hypothetical protein
MRSRDLKIAGFWKITRTRLMPSYRSTTYFKYPQRDSMRLGTVYHIHKPFWILASIISNSSIFYKSHVLSYQQVTFSVPSYRIAPSQSSEFQLCLSLCPRSRISHIVHISRISHISRPLPTYRPHLATSITWSSVAKSISS